MGLSKYIEPPKRSDCKWRNGRPPSIGWWPASVSRLSTSLRWWNGRHWSIAAFASFDSTLAAECAAQPRLDEHAGRIRWTDRWWEGKC